VRVDARGRCARSSRGVTRARERRGAGVARVWVALNLGFHRSWTDRFVSFRLSRVVSDALFELSALAGVEMRREIHDAILALTREKVVPTATAQVLRSLASKASDARSAGIKDALRSP